MAVTDQFKLAERMSLSQAEETDLSAEIELFRVELRRYFAAESAALGSMDYDLYPVRHCMHSALPSNALTASFPHMSS